MKNLCGFLFLLILCGNPLSAQSSSIFKGILTDAQTAEAIPFAHINILNRPGNGFITRLDGSFFWDAFETKDTILQVRISALGYVSKSITLNDNTFNTIQLQPSAEVLSDILVSPTFWERALIERLINKIPQNYPVGNERLTGLVTEETFADSALTTPFYAARVVIEADKPSYSNRSSVGQVRVVTGETEYFPAADTAWLGIQAGAFNIFRFDLVGNRRGPLRKSDLKDYYFFAQDTLLQDEDKILVMAYESKAYRGKLYINMSDTALVRAEVIDIDYEAGQGGFSLRSSERLFLHYDVSYGKFEGAYRLRHIHYQTAFAQQRDSLFLENTFSIVAVVPASESSPQGTAINYTERLVDYTPEIKRFSDGSTVTNETPSILKFFRKLVFGYAVVALPQERLAFTGQLTGDLALQKSWDAEQRLRIAAGVSMAYPIYKRLWLSLESVGVGAKEAVNVTTIGLSYKQPLTFSQRYSVVAGIDYLGMVHLDRFYGYEHSEQIVLNNRPFDSGKIDFTYRQISHGIAPRIAFDAKINNALTIRVQGTYPIVLGSRQEVLAIEENERWFWNRSSTSIRENNGFQSSTSQPFSNNWWVGIGVIWK